MKGTQALRRKLRRLPDDLNEGIRREIRADGELVQNRMRVSAPYDPDSDLKDWEGKARPHLRDAIELRFSRDGLTARVGFITKKVTNVFYYVRMLEFGFHVATGAQATHRARRQQGQTSGEKFVRRPFVLPSWLEVRDRVRVRIRTVAKKTFTEVMRRSEPDV